MENETNSKLAELIYDKLADNDEYEQFNPCWADDMCVVYKQDGTPVIALLKGDTEYVLKIEKHEKGAFEVYENEPTLKIADGKIEYKGREIIL